MASVKRTIQQLDERVDKYLKIKLERAIYVKWQDPSSLNTYEVCPLDKNIQQLALLALKKSRPFEVDISQPSTFW